MNLSNEQLQKQYLPITLFLVAFLTKFFFINTRDICLDEPFTIYHAQFPVLDILRLPAQNEPNPPLFMLLLHFWIKLFGIDPISVRTLPLLFNSITVVFIYAIGKRFFNLWTGLLASCIFILSTYHFYFGLETRTYSLLSMGSAIALFNFLSLLQVPNKKTIIYLILVNSILIYSHYFGFFILLIQFISAFFYLNNKKMISSIFIVLLGTGIAFIPMISIVVNQFFHSSKGTWVQPPTNADYYIQLWMFLNSKEIFMYTLSTLFIGIILAFFTKKIKFYSLNLNFLIILLWWIVPYTIMFFVSFKMPIFINRYILFNTIGLYLFIAVFITLLFEQKWSYLIGGLLLIYLFKYLEINSKEFYYREINNVVTKVKDNSTKNNFILLYPQWAHLGFMYYFDRNTFQNYEKYDSLITLKNVYPVWNLDEVKEKISRFKNQKIIYVQDGELGDYEIYQYLDSNFTVKDSVFYPQCFQFAVFIPK
jgi:mannosyltransferase